MREEALGDVGHARREIAIGREHGLARIVPADHLLGLLGQRRVTVPMRKLLLAEPSRLHGVVAVRDARVSLAHGGDECVDHLLLHAIGEVARIGHVDEAAPTVGDFLVLGERVGDEREQPHVLLERLGQSFCCLSPLLLVLIEQAIECWLEAELLVADDRI